MGFCYLHSIDAPIYVNETTGVCMKYVNESVIFFTSKITCDLAVHADSIMWTLRVSLCSYLVFPSYFHCT